VNKTTTRRLTTGGGMMTNPKKCPRCGTEGCPTAVAIPPEIIRSVHDLGGLCVADIDAPIRVTTAGGHDDD
jgi:hypothetical protein